MKRDLTVYVASAWYRDCDPFVTAVALTPKAARSAIICAIRDETDASETNEDDIAWSGVHTWSLREAFKGTFGRMRRDDLKAELRGSGVAYPDVS